MILRRGDRKQRRIAAVGMYDGVHRGHRFLIDYVCRMGEERGLTPCAVTFDSHPLTKVRPECAPAMLQTAEAKFRMLQGAGAADVIVLDFDEKLRHMSAKEFLQMLKRRWSIDTLVLGFNNGFGHDRPSTLSQYREIGQKVGVEVISAPEFRAADAQVSSSVIRQLVRDGNVTQAAALLGRRYDISGTVVHGKRLGRSLGFPTANIEPDASKPTLLPGNGVYAAVGVLADGRRCGAVVNIGCRPTVDNSINARVSIEANLLDYMGDLYGQRMTLEFVKRLRDEQKFDNLQQLKEAIKTDAAAAREALRHLPGLASLVPDSKE